MLAGALKRFPRLGWLLVALLLGAVFGVGQETPRDAEAHALLVRADPPVNAQLKEAPESLTLYFSESLERRFSDIRVEDQDGNRVEDRVEFDDTDSQMMRVYLKPLTPGYVTVFWENVSAVDGHRISGTYPLTILNPDGSLPFGTPPGVTTSQVSGTEANPGRVVSKIVLLIAGCLLTGAFAFAAWVLPALPDPTSNGGSAVTHAVLKRARTLSLLAFLLLVVGGLLQLFVQAADVGVGVSDVISTTWGERWALRNVLLIVPALALIGLAANSRVRGVSAWAGLAGALAYLLVTATVSHGAAGVGAFWAIAADFVHLVATSVWLGMLVMLLLFLIWARKAMERLDRYETVATALQRFSVAAVVSLALLLFTGTINTVIELGHVSDLLDAPYGRSLLAKLLLIVPLLIVGAVNAYVLRPSYVEQVDESVSRNRGQLDDLEKRLGGMMRFELLLAVIVLAVVGLLVQYTPTRGLADRNAVTEGKLTETAQSDNISATLVIDPNQPGLNSFDVYLAGGINVVDSVRLNFYPPSGPGNESRLVLDASNPPTYYVGRGPYLNEPGTWKIEVFIRRTEGSDIAIPFQVKLRDAAGAPAKAESGGAFSAPTSLTAVSAALLALSLVAALGIVIGSSRPVGVPGGYLGLAAEEIAYRLGGFRMRPAWSLAALIVVGIGLGLVLGSHFHGRLSPEQASVGNPVQSSPDSIAAGKVLFMANCILCHGETGRGDGPLAETLPLRPANLYDHIPYHPDQFFYAVMTQGLSGVMPAFGNTLSEEDRWNVLNYLRDTFGQPPPQQ